MRLQKIDKIWANRVQREIDQLKRKPTPGVLLDDRTSFDASTGDCVIMVRCIIDPVEAEEAAKAAAASEEATEGESGAATSTPVFTKSFVMSVDIGLKSRCVYVSHKSSYFR